MLAWSVHETGGSDTAWATLDADGRTLVASGRAFGLRPHPYWLAYEFETDVEYATRRMWVEARSDAGTATVELRREGGHWTVNGAARPDLDAALDCDHAACPLTNTMPILRHRLHEGPGDRSLVMAFIEVPGLRVIRSEQRYRHLYRLPDGSAIVRYRSSGFEDDLVFDADGFVINYPRLGRRLEP
jgi:hypothetical protein